MKAKRPSRQPLDSRGLNSPVARDLDSREPFRSSLYAWHSGPAIAPSKSVSISAWRFEARIN